MSALPVAVPVVTDLVAIEAPADSPQAELAAESCSAVLGSGECRLVDAVAARAAPKWHVRLRWVDAEQVQAQIEVRRGSPAGPLVSVRQVEFSKADSLEQRYKALGLVIASHVIATESPLVSEPAPAPKEPPAPVAPEAEPQTSRLGLDLGVIAGQGLQAGGARFGLLARGWLRPFDVPLVVLLGGRWAQAGALPAASWVSGSAGLAARVALPVSGTSVDVRNEVVVERVSVSATDVETGSSDRESLWRFGGRLGVDLVVELGEDVGVFAGVEGTVLRPEYQVEVEGSDRGGEPAARWAGVAGVRLFP